MQHFFQPRSQRLKSDDAAVVAPTPAAVGDDEGESTDFKLAVLQSLHPQHAQDVHLEYLLAHDGDTTKASDALGAATSPFKRKRPHAATTIGYQSSLDDAFTTSRDSASGPSASASASASSASSTGRAAKSRTKKGSTLHLYSPRDIEAHTPCSIIHSFLPAADADALLRELLAESTRYSRGTFQLFERTVQTPHTWKFYVDTLDRIREQKSEYLYDGLYEADVAQTTPEMLRVSARVRDAVNVEIRRRTRDFHPRGQKLRFQSPEPWEPNASFVNCYDGARENVGYHSDQLTYLGPRAVIGSLSLGVAREFRVRRIVPRLDASAADEQGQIAIHLPHNSLLVMHAEMQEEWKHSIAPAQTIDPHPLAGNKRLNVTYRCYRDYLKPRHTPRCRCGVACVLRCIQRQQATRGRYVWMCYANYTPGRPGCEHFQWAEFDVDGRPPWVEGYQGNANVPKVGNGDVDGDDECTTGAARSAVCS